MFNKSVLKFLKLININILKEFKLIFYKNLINIIFNLTYINYIYKITLIFVLFLIWSFFENFQNISINFKSFMFNRCVKIFTNILDISVKSKYLCLISVCVWLAYCGAFQMRFIFHGQELLWLYLWMQIHDHWEHK